MDQVQNLAQAKQEKNVKIINIAIFLVEEKKQNLAFYPNSVLLNEYLSRLIVVIRNFFVASATSQDGRLFLPYKVRKSLITTDIIISSFEKQGLTPRILTLLSSHNVRHYTATFHFDLTF